MKATIGALLKSARATLEKRSIPSARLDAEVLLAHTLDKDRTFLFLNDTLAVSEAEAAAFQDLVDRRSHFEPVAHLVGSREFWGLEFHISADTLIPRPDSETLVEAVLDRVVDQDQPFRILDLGTGSGCLLLSLLHALPNASGCGVDKSAGAIAVAEKNVAALKLGGRAAFYRASWESLDGDIVGHFDIIISNPPYIPSADLADLMPDVGQYEPASALNGGPDGLDAYRVLATLIPKLLKDGGLYALEVGDGQAEAIESLFKNTVKRPVHRICDLAGIDRVLLGYGENWAPKVQKHLA